MSNLVTFEAPTARQIAEIYALSTEIRELHYHKIRPFVVAGTGALSDSLFKYINSTDSIFYNIKQALANVSLDILLDKESLAVVRKVQSGLFTWQDEIRYQQIYGKELQEAMWNFQLILIACIQVPMLGILYYLNKNMAKKAINYINFKDALPEQNIKAVRLSATEIKILIKKLQTTRNNLRKISYNLSKYSIVLFFVLMFLGNINYTLSVMFNESKYLPWLMVFAAYTAVESYWTKRSLQSIESNYATFFEQLNEITKKLNLKWMAEKGGYLSSSYFTLDMKNKACLNEKYGQLPKEIFLKVIKQYFLDYDCTVICFNPSRGIILTRDKPFNATELSKIEDDIITSLIQASCKYKNTRLLITQLNKVSNQFACRQTWNYYPEKDYFAINLNNASKENIVQIENMLIKIYGKEGIHFNKSSGYLIAKQIIPAEPSALMESFNKLISQQSHTNYISTPPNQQSFIEVSTPVTTIKRPVDKPKKAKRLLTDIQPEISNPSKDENKIEDTLYPVYSPNVPANTHYSRYRVPDKDIMAVEIGNKTLHTKFFEVVKNGQMGGKGNHIARLKKPKQVKGFFGNSIFATHKLIIPALDMRIYGVATMEEDKTVLEFDTVVPKHKWDSRS